MSTNTNTTPQTECFPEEIRPLLKGESTKEEDVFNKASSTPSTVSASLTEFPLFGDLPLEVREVIWEFSLDNIEPRLVYLKEKVVPISRTLGDKVRSDIPIGEHHPDETPMRSVILSPSEYEQFRSDVADIVSLKLYFQQHFNPSHAYPFMHGIQSDDTKSGSLGVFYDDSNPIGEAFTYCQQHIKRLLGGGWIQIEYQDEDLAKQLEQIYGWERTSV